MRGQVIEKARWADATAGIGNWRGEFEGGTMARASASSSSTPKRSGTVRAGTNIPTPKPLSSATGAFVSR